MNKNEKSISVKYPEAKKFILTEQEFKNLTNQIENQKIDIKKTIQKAAMGDLFGVKYSYATPLNNHDEFPKEIPELLNNGKSYETFLDDEFFEKALECVNKDHGIYIGLVYATDESGPADINFRKENSSNGDENSEDYGNIILINSPHDGVLCYFNEDFDIYADMTSDYGINIRKVNGSYKNTIGLRSAGLHCWDPQDFSEGIADEPLDQIILKLIYDAIIFE